MFAISGVRAIYAIIVSLPLACAPVASAVSQPSGAATSPSMGYVVPVETAYYSAGPQQGRPPEGTLPSGTRIRILREAGSYVQVETEAGQTVFVAADAVRRAPE